MTLEQIKTLGGGFDVSHHNVDDRGTPIDWQAAKTAGYQFVLIKASDGASFADPRFAENVAGARAAGFAVGAYHFLRPGKDAAAQATHFLAQVTAVGIQNLDLGAAVDVEGPDDDPGAWTRISRQTRLLKVQHCLTPVEAAFPDPALIYCIPQWWAHNLGSDTDFSAHPHWAASPSSIPDLRGTTWAAWTLWQFKFTGTVPGVGFKSVDLDRTA